MVTPSKSNQTKSRENPLQTSEGRLRRGSKPLSKFKFYLDVKNHVFSTKLEAKVKELGGAIELFLVREVTHVVTDQSVTGGPRTPSTPASATTVAVSPSPGPSGCLSHDSGSVASPAGQVKASRIQPQSRADAMLERARQQPQALLSSRSPLELARTWSMPIWTVEQALKFLTKVCSTVKVEVADRNNKCKNQIKSRALRGNYIKIENFKRNNRPVYKELQKGWPELTTDGDFGCCPFTLPNSKIKSQRSVSNHKSPNLSCRSSKKDIIVDETEPQRMTRKTRLRPREPLPQCGYCEICHIEYPDLTNHVRSEEHLNFVRNDANFLTLDTLISAGANVEAFLKLNGSSKEHSTPYSFGRRSLRSVIKPNSIKRDAMDAYTPPRTRRSGRKKLNSSDKNQRLRSRGQLWLPSSLIGTTAEDICSKSPKDAVRTPLKSNGLIDDDIVQARRVKGIRWRCPSSDARPVVPVSPCYKVVGRPLKPQKTEGLVVKFKKVRQSELSMLSDEAENFMFPKREESSEDTDEDRPSIEHESPKSSSDFHTSSPHKTELEDTTVSRRKRRRTQAEAFIVDNTNYYKFESPCSRLRFQSAPAQSLCDPEEARVTSIKKEILSEGETEADEGEYESEGQAEEDEAGAIRIITTPEIEKLPFTFEAVPSSEAWYNTYKRQDEHKEFTLNRILELSDCSYKKTFKLPYEMGPLPPLTPNCCRLNIVEGEPKRKVGNPGGKKRRRHNQGPRPRKSPREHASTLATLAGLVHQRKRKSSGKSDLTSIPEHSESDFSNFVSLPEKCQVMQVSDAQTANEITSKIDDLFSEDCDEKEVFEMDHEIDPECVNIKPELGSIVEILSSYKDCDLVDDQEILSGIQSQDRSRLSGFCRQDGSIRFRKKRKKNRTGWPNKKKLILRKYSNTNVELDKSVLNLSEESMESPLADNESVNLNAPNDTSDEVSSIIVEVSSEPPCLVESVSPEHNMDSCSNTTDSGKENQCSNEKPVLEDSEIFSNISSKADTSDKIEVLKIVDAVEVEIVNEVLDELPAIVESEASVDEDTWEATTLPSRDEEDLSVNPEYQPFVCVQKMDEAETNRQLRSQTTTHSALKRKSKKYSSLPQTVTVSPRRLRAPRGRWYRER